MPRHEPKSDEAIEVRSVLMRLYHSRQMGEDFYPAQLVNGHAPQMEADGWIEWCGQGWRLTDAGLKVWAEMNPSLITYKYQYGQKMFDEMRAVLKGEDEMETICCVEGCGQPRMISQKGETLQRCVMHQREYWREQAAKKEAKKKAANPIPAPRKRGGVVKSGTISQIADNEIKEVFVPPLPIGTVVSVDMNDLGEQPPTMEMKSVYLSVPEAHDCEHCEAKAIIGMLKARSPKLAALIEAMEDVQRKADDLGL